MIKQVSLLQSKWSSLNILNTWKQFDATDASSWKIALFIVLSVVTHNKEGDDLIFFLNWTELVPSDPPVICAQAWRTHFRWVTLINRYLLLSILLLWVWSCGQNARTRLQAKTFNHAASKSVKMDVVGNKVGFVETPAFEVSREEAQALKGLFMLSHEWMIGGCSFTPWELG